MPGSDFLQSPPHLGNQWLEDGFLQSQLRRLMPDKLRNVEPDLERFGWQVATRIKILGQAAEAQPPRLLKQDAWGSQLDSVLTADAWKQLKALSAEEGLVAAAYEQQQGPHSRVVSDGQVAPVWRIIRLVQLPAGNDRWRRSPVPAAP